MKSKGLLRLLVPISLVVALAVALPLAGGCFPAPPPEEVKPIKLGAALPLTGWAAGEGVIYRQGISYAVDEINAQGGLLGRPVTIVVFDTQECSPEVLIEAADTLVGQKKVDVVHSGWSGSGQDVIAFGKYDVPLFHGDATQTCVDIFLEDPDKYFNVFMLTGVEPDYGRLAVEFMEFLPYEYPNNKIALISADDAWSVGYIDGVQLEAEAAGWEVVVYEVVPYGTREWAPILTKIRAEEPAWIVMESYEAADQATFYRQFIEDPTNTLINFGYAYTNPEFLGLLGEEADGIVGMGSLLSIPAPTLEAKEWHDGFGALYGFEPTGAHELYGGVMLWANAVRQVGDVTDYRAICEYIATGSFEIIPGTGILYEFLEGQYLDITKAPYTWTQVQEGSRETLFWRGEAYVDYLGNTVEFQVPRWIE